MVVSVNDVRSNPNEQIAHAVAVLKRSARLQLVFDAICKGGAKPKSVSQLMERTGMTQVAVLQLGGRLADQQLVLKTKVGKETAYAKDRYLASKRTTIHRMIKDPKKLAKLPTKYSPRSSGGSVIRVSVPGAKIQIKELHVDDFDQFAKIKRMKPTSAPKISERAFKDGVLRLIGSTGKFQDWGGEPNDLYTTKLRHKGQRRAMAFAFKGPGTKGELTPKKLGKNGDQIQRLFLAPAEIFVVQYHDAIGQSVVEQVKAFASINSVREGKKIFYCLIDGDDTNRLIMAYPRQFGLK
ncbi:hypothetical protein JQ594_01900 [Bradyrhizobium manausense]|uniref:hypothetical protein n=1 Tax=Bradyrhizobium manausense TaxID=989370 RepID=UPI001BAC946B|nr:hypothetical protein [Bradyrhizobium manausense]MBR0684655.1 hypothetical protein [Bradyrhizobium manausense]